METVAVLSQVTNTKNCKNMPNTRLSQRYCCCCRVGAGNSEFGLVEKETFTLRPQKPLRLIRDGEVGGSGILYLTPTRYLSPPE